MKNDRFGPYMYSIIETSECLKKEAKWKKKLSQKNILAGLLARPNELNNAEN